MPSKSYCLKYRRLKRIYEREIGKEVADITWRRVLSTLKQHFDFKVEALNSENLVKRIGNFKKQYGIFSGRSEGFNERWKAFSHFYEMDKQFSGKDFLIALAKYLQIELKDVPRSTKYYWFTKACLSYKTNGSYESKDLALVAFIACKWAINKRSSVMKSAEPNNHKLTIGRSNNHG
ncbi:MAG: hypothetical protein HC836_37180 [Richelia sp. RM2_1_2]|nr:hypothetical protein [Richelia sp. RM1_1_1]NJO63625.1 hypothetical protein [Richelia sp. RM2_1_2]